MPINGRILAEHLTAPNIAVHDLFARKRIADRSHRAVNNEEYIRHLIHMPENLLVGGIAAPLTAVRQRIEIVSGHIPKDLNARQRLLALYQGPLYP